MSLKLNERYPGRYNNPSTDYPQGSFKNRTTPTAKDGSYLEQDWANDKEGFFQSLLAKAVIEANGNVDKVGSSQAFDALMQLGQNQEGKAFTTAGTATALTLTPVPAIQAYAANQRFSVKFSVTAGANPTLNVSAKGPKNLKQYDANGLKIAAAFVADQISDVVYDGVDWVLLAQVPSALVGTTGSARNLKMVAAGTNAVAAITADELTVSNAAGQYQTLRNVSVSVNLAAAGLNGLDTGSMATNTWYATYVIWNPNTNARGAIASLNYTAPALPAGYTHWAFIESVRVGVTVTRILPFLKLGTDTMFVPTAGTDIPADFPVLVNGGTATTFTAVSLQGFIPPNAKSAQIGLNCAGTTAGRAEVYAGSTGTNSGLLAQAMTNGTSGPRIQFNVIEPFIKGIYYAVVSPGSASIFAFGWRS
jgi:hypothetical protein